MLSTDKVVGGAIVALGTWAAWKHLTRVLIDNAKREMSRRDRASEWQLFAGAVAFAVSGVAWWINWINKGSIRWLFGAAGILILIWMLVSDLASWWSNRAKREPDDPSATEP